jgi:hypothetical protein
MLKTAPTPDDLKPLKVTIKPLIKINSYKIGWRWMCKCADEGDVQMTMCK